MGRKPWREKTAEGISDGWKNVCGVKFRHLRWLGGDKRDEHLELTVLNSSQSSQDSCRKKVEQRGGPAPMCTSAEINNIIIFII